MNTPFHFPKKWTAFGIVLLSIMLPYFFAAFFVEPTGDIQQENLRTYIFIGELFVVLPSLVYAYRKKYPFDTIFRIRKVSSTSIGWAALIGLSVSILSDELDRLISLVVNPPEWLSQSMEFFQIDSRADFLLLVGAIVFIAPIAEELLFRGFLQTTLEFRIQDVTKAILVTSLAFALLHMNSWWVIQIYLFGIVLSYLSWRTQSIFPGIVAHMAINGLSILFANLEPSTHLRWYEMGNHVSIIWLVLAGYGFYRGIIAINLRHPLDLRESRTIIPIDHGKPSSDNPI